MVLSELSETLLLGATAGATSGELGSSQVGEHLEALDELGVGGEEGGGLLGGRVSS